MNASLSSAKTTQRNLGWPMTGLGLAILGLVIQWISKPSIFEAPDWGALPGNFPPGILVIVVFGGLTLLTARWWWSPVFAAAIGAWIIYGGVSTGEMTNAFTNGNAGSVFGLVVMSSGLLVAIATGVLATVQRRHSQ